ncbi:MAG: TCR/Tet family MFS transporter [Cyclobacteriaceae bacterium]|nr:TCR/Tet family MFS transporter [Cyclobacteriaceae bacterium]MCB0500157.1 TCR/Tet family MFS transporter [Cyclobacteriaceae bacterium]MCB9237115.1 TCR/Tet family MFS transporter [Flammeovirgaceae bacterium]MCO5270824.1 TCR/Tet family MFS transporter [Cyclobacteriaceae bacterium]MCW5901890.1 TCR/Tet family MFS transporter [Cyclobacteriaceae bacterium]
MLGHGKAALGFIFVTLLIDVIGFGIIIPVMPTLIQELTGGTLAQASSYGGWLLFAYAFMQFLCAPIVGNLSDQFGRRPILLASLFGFGIDYLFMAFAPTLAWLFLGRTIAGVMGASFTTASAYIADLSTPDKRAQNFGILGAAFGLGFIIGPLIGGLVGAYGTRLPFLVAAGLTLVNWLYGFFILPESLSVENRRKFEWARANPVGSLLSLKRFPIIMGLVVSLVLVYISAHAVQSNWSYYTMERFHWDERMIGISLAVVGIVFAVVQGGLIRVVIPRLGQERSVYVGLGLYASGYFLFAFATQSWMMFAITIPYCMGSIAGPAIQGIISNQVPANEQGELQGALTSLMSVTSIIGPLLMTQIFYFFTRVDAPSYLPGAPMLLGGMLTVISALLARRTLKRSMAAKLP